MRTSLVIAVLGGLMVSGCGGSGGDAPAQNSAPKVSAITDKSVTANEASAPIGFSISDDTTAANDLTVAAMTAGEGIVVDDGIEIMGNASERSLIITPNADEIGNAVISVMVTDGEGLSDASSFQLTVEPQQELLSEFARNNFVESEDGDPMPINAIVFDQDADEDEFEDLLNF